MKYRIMYKYENEEPEEIDTAEDTKEAIYLLNEYRLAYRGMRGVSLWKEKIKEANYV